MDRADSYKKLLTASHRAYLPSRSYKVLRQDRATSDVIRCVSEGLLGHVISIRCLCYREANIMAGQASINDSIACQEKCAKPVYCAKCAMISDL